MSTSSSSSTDMDFAIFKQASNNCFGKTQKEQIEIEQCAHLNRIVHALKYYQLLSIESKPSNAPIFANFAHTVYTQFINDYIHVIDTHGPHLEQINNALMHRPEFGTCDAFKCKLFQRYNDVSRRGINLNGRRRGARHQHNDKALDEQIENDSETDELAAIYADLLDTIHYWLFHLFDVGMRSRKNTKMNSGKDDEIAQEQEKKYFDAELARIQQSVLEKQKKYNLDADSCRAENGKFNLSTYCAASANDASEGEKGLRSTFIDELMQYFERCHVAKTALVAFQRMLDDEQYDSDALLNDLDDDQDDMNSSNILHVVNDDEFSRVAAEHVQTSKVPSFVTGFIWFYWDYYKHKDDVDQLPANEINYGVQRMKELYVAPKYGNYKTEVLAHIDLIDFPFGDITVYAEIQTKVKLLMKSNKVKSMKANMFCERGYRHYGIAKRAALSINHVKAILLYCNYSKYCTALSSTFRRLKWYESLAVVRRRNSAFYWQCRYLREAVEIYGKDGGYFCKGDAAESGPFFCGVNMVLAVPEFSIRLCAPTSTSKAVEVATKFADARGMIIRMNNQHNRVSKCLPFFDCVWISRYPDEDERLFCGGLFMLRIESVMLVKQNMNFQVIIESLFVIDNMLSGGANVEKISISNKAKKMILSLVASRFANTSTYHPYIRDVLKSYIIKKTKIDLILHGLHNGFDAKMYAWILEGTLNRCVDEKYAQKNAKLKDSNKALCMNVSNISSRINLISTEFLNMFPNAKIIQIDAMAFAFNIFYFLENLTNAPNWKQVIIKNTAPSTRIEWNWMNQAWSNCESKIRSVCSERQWKIEYNQKTGKYKKEYKTASLLIWK